MSKLLNEGILLLILFLIVGSNCNVPKPVSNTPSKNKNITNPNLVKTIDPDQAEIDAQRIRKGGSG